MHAVTRKERDRNIRKGDILDAAEHVFATKGFHDTTISDIAKAAQYAVGTIYIYFKDKEELYLTLIEKKTEDLHLRIKKELAEGKNAIEKLKIFILTEIKYFNENENFFKIYFTERNTSRWTIKDRLSNKAVSLYFNILENVEGIIKEGQKEGSIKKNMDTRKLSFMLSAMVRSIIMPKLMGLAKTKEIDTDLGDLIFEVFYEGAGER